MPQLKRYTAMPFEDDAGNEFDANMEEMADGEWVRWGDIEKLAIHLSSGGKPDEPIYTRTDVQMLVGVIRALEAHHKAKE